MGYFVKDYLLHFPKIAVLDQMATDGNSSCSKVTLPGTIDCPIESKGVVDQAMLNK
jgi:hypothetical protein